MKRWLSPITPIIAALLVATACGGGTAPSAGGSATPSAAAQDTELVFYSGGDTNVQDLHMKQIIPAFEKATGIKVTFTFLEHGTGAQGIYDRIKAQKDTGKTQWDIDLWESDTGYYTRPDDLFLQVSATDIPNLAKIPKATLDFVQNKAVPYRGSSVVLAYNSDKVANPPQTCRTRRSPTGARASCSHTTPTKSRIRRRHTTTSSPGSRRTLASSLTTSPRPADLVTRSSSR